ncbi:hypothetical protein Pcinc_035980 [Petrolisthes cinctipes]|uniref:Uncharacterized protein n=1 Tax=Petrolisthes cinctipes TaxID=88211 RepID=A0AAE1EMF7_PETCI|nr:hypothetical protein Pcinc_035980 [Petrolisthes cinctipes]
MLRSLKVTGIHEGPSVFGLPRGYLQSQEGTKNQEGTSRWIPAVKGTQMMAKVCKSNDPRIPQKKDPLMMTTTHARPDDHPWTLFMPDLTEGDSSVLLTTDRPWTCRSGHSIICSSDLGSSRSEKTHSDPCDYSGIQVPGTYLCVRLPGTRESGTRTQRRLVLLNAYSRHTCSHHTCSHHTCPCTTSVFTTPVFTTLIPTTPVPTTPVPTTPVSTTPVSTTPVPTTPVSTTPVSTTPVATTPVSTTPVPAPHLSPPHLFPPHLSPPHLSPPHLLPPHLFPPHLFPPHLSPPHLSPTHLSPPHLSPPHLSPPHLSLHHICLHHTCLHHTCPCPTPVSTTPVPFIPPESFYILS